MIFFESLGRRVVAGYRLGCVKERLLGGLKWVSFRGGTGRWRFAAKLNLMIFTYRGAIEVMPSSKVM